ncbi:hypothetical protein V6N11_067568 [Hibiscus sabdariffa]|uniref:Uncharacterized protein n=1 Tax=Hibiscus sabdariffa TaxID=183260 RepID=A0ABR2SR87_9ROSI
MKRVQSFQSVREEEVDLLIESISKSATIAFGKRFQGSELDIYKLQKLVFEAQSMLGSFCASDFLPYAGKVIDCFTGFHRRLENSFRELDAVFQQVIGDHLESGTTVHD